MDQPLRKPKLSSHPVDVGQRSEGAIIAELVRRGYHVLVPFGVNQRYDLVIDVDGRFVRAQCKTGRLRAGSVVFATRSVLSNTRRSICRDYAGQADLFLVYCPETDGVYVVPVKEASMSHMSLRVEPTSNRQAQGINWARDFQLPA